MDHEPKQQPGNDRRAVLKTALAGGSLGALLLPGSWIKPVLDTVIVPAHAATSTAVTTTTVAPTTTIAPTTTDVGLLRG